MSQIKALISDADGTLVNTIFLIRHGQYEAAVQYLLSQKVPRADIPKYDRYENYINRSVGGSTKDTFQKTFKLLYGDTIYKSLLKKIDFDKLDNSLTPVQDHLAPLYVHPFHGLTELFNWAGKKQINLGIVTSGNRRMIIRNFGVSIPDLGYTELFQADDIDVNERFTAFLTRAKAVYNLPKFEVITCDDVVKTKPDPEGLQKMLNKLRFSVNEVLVMGDHPSDMQAASAAGLHAIGITHGFSSPAELKKAGALRVVDSLLTVPKLIDNHNTGLKKLF
jgi:phosphoglycolate phosphatase-like HAD superfamily hydrolase